MRKSIVKGFTLIELLVVISIIGVLASVVLASLSDARNAARDAKIKTEIKQVQTALEMFRNDNNGKYPRHKDGGLHLKDLNGLSAWGANNDITPYIKPIPNTPHPGFPNYGYWSVVSGGSADIAYTLRVQLSNSSTSCAINVGGGNPGWSSLPPCY